ncbi:MAG: type II toxin-antitoxin system Phd/YefM family antitoxin [Chloroflexota bacterium]
MERSVGVEEARSRLGQLADEVAEADESVVLTRRGHAVAVLVSAAEYRRLMDERRRLARAELEDRLADVRQRVAAAGLDTSVVEEAIAAARRVE